MIAKRFTKNKLVQAIFGCLFGIIGMLAGVNSVVMAEPAYAEPVDSVVTEDENNEGEKTEAEDDGADLEKASGESCDDSFGKIGWIICPGTGVASKAVDFLYEKIETVLVINPVEMKDGEPIYEIWKYAKGVTNIVFIIFLMVVVYSQLTGLGITNYGIKKALPKLIVAAVMVNLSFVVCSLAVDASNVIGNGLRGIFTSIEQSTVALMNVDEGIATSDLYSALAGGSMLAIFLGIAAFESGTMWMLLLTVLTALVAVVIGLVTIAMRQAVVMLLVMVSPLAVVAYMLPNTEQWFKKWRQLLVKMLVFYPVFSVLFGASSLAGWAIIASAISSKDGFMTLVGVGVRIFPLFFSWKLMQMSGTVLGTINSKLTSLASRPLAKGRSWAESRRDATRAKNLASGRVYTPSLALMQYMNNRKIARDEEMNEHNATIKNRGLAYAAMRNYKKNGTPSREGERAYEEQALNMQYMKTINWHKNNMNGGYTRLEAVKMHSSAAQMARLGVLDSLNINASDDLKAELARGAEIEYENATGFYERALNAKLADGDNKALLNGNDKHQQHPGALTEENLARYERFKSIMDGNDDGVQTVLADAASSAHAQMQIRRNKFQAAGDLTPATQNVEDHVRELINSPNAVKNIDAIIGGLRVLNMRGDTDLAAKEAARNLVGVLGGRIELGTYASQAVANYTMFDVKDNDPVLRRFGKYINMQTAALYNDNDPEKRRVRRDVSWREYVNSEYVEYDHYDDNGEGVLARDEEGHVKIKKTRGMKELMFGTPYGAVERTAYKAQREGVRAASYDLDEDGNLASEMNVKRYFDNMDNLYDSTLANIIGDQFSYRSGSEQILALAKDLTGIGKDGKWDWKYIFGEEVPDPTQEQKAEYIMRSRNLVKKFLGGHVASQIARSKSDMLSAIQSQYALFDEVMVIDEDGEERVDLDRLSEIESRTFVDGDKSIPGSYKNFLEQKKEAIRKRMRSSFKGNALEGFAKQTKRGYQGESKELLFEMLPMDELYREYVDNNRRNTSTNEEEEGAPANSVPDVEAMSAETYNEARERIRESFERYSRDGGSVENFWNDANSIIRSSASMGDLSVSLSEFAEGVPQYTDVAQLYNDIMRTFFGSD